MTIRFCNHCGEPIGEGHILDYWHKYHYYCDENCLRKDNPSLDNISMEEMYNEDIQYYTTWYDDDSYDLTACYRIGDEYFFDFENRVDERIDIYWVIINDDEWVSAKSFKGDTKGVIRLFDSMEDARDYYVKHFIE